MRSMLLAVLVLGWASGPLEAQEGQKWVGVLAGWDVQNQSSRNVKDNPVFGLTFGHWCTDRWGYDLSVLSTQLHPKGDGNNADEYHGHVSGLFNLKPGGGTWIPYLRLGVGATQVDTPWSFSSGRTTRLSANGGIGLQANLAEGFLLGLEAREVRIETRTSANETLGLVTLAYRFGGRKAAPPAPAPQVTPPPPPPEPPAPEPLPPPKAEEPAPPPPPPPPAPKVEPPPPARIVLDEATLHFANGKNTLSPEGIEAVRKVAESLKAYQGAYTLVVSGYTSSTGKAAFNKALSKRRADAVARVLVEAGIPEASLKTVGEGPEKPIADNKTKEGQAKNRRVEIDVKASAEVETRHTETPVSE